MAKKTNGMTGRQWRNALKTLGLSIVGAAPVFGIKRRQSQRYAAGESDIPDPLAKLVRLALAHGLSADDIRNA